MAVKTEITLPSLMFEDELVNYLSKYKKRYIPDSWRLTFNDFFL